MIVITGAAGQVGTALVHKLSKRGHKIKAIVTKYDDTTALQRPNVDIVVGDVCDCPFLIEQFSGASTVFHVAGIISISPGENERMERVNVGGMKNVIAACRKNDVQRLVYTSSVHAFVELPHGQLIDETAPVDPEKVVGHYAKTKAKATLLLRDAIRNGLDAVIVYPSGIIGPYSYTLSNMGQMMIDYIRGRIPVMIDGTYDFVDVRDVAYGAILASEKAASGEEFILSGYQISLKQIFYILQNVTGRKIPRIYFPNWLLILFIPFVKLISNIVRKVPTLTSYSLYTLSSNSLFSHEKATKILGYHPRHIVRTIEDTVAWFKEIGML